MTDYRYRQIREVLQAAGDHLRNTPELPYDRHCQARRLAGELAEIEVDLEVELDVDSMVDVAIDNDSGVAQ